MSEPREVKKRDAFVQIGFVSVLVSLNLTGSDSDSRATQHRTSSVWLVRSENRPKGISGHLDDSHDYVCLNFGGNLAAAMFARNH